MRIYALKGLKVFSNFSDPYGEWNKLESSRPLVYADKELLLKDFESKKFLLLYELYSTAETLKSIPSVKKPEGVFKFAEDIEDPKEEVKKLVEKTAKRFGKNKLRTIAEGKDVNKKILAIRYFINLRKLCEYAGLEKEVKNLESELLKPLVRGTLNYVLDGNLTVNSYQGVLQQLKPKDLSSDIYKLLSGLDLVMSMTLWSKYVQKSLIKKAISPHDPSEFVKKDLIPLVEKVLQQLNEKEVNAQTLQEKFEILAIRYRVLKNLSDLLDEVKVLTGKEDFGKFNTHEVELNKVVSLLEENLIEQLKEGENWEVVKTLGVENAIKSHLYGWFKGKTLREVESNTFVKHLLKEEIENLKELQRGFLNKQKPPKERIELFETYEVKLKKLGLVPAEEEKKTYKLLKRCLENWENFARDIELNELANPQRALEILENFKSKTPECAELFGREISNRELKLKERIKDNLEKIKRLWDNEEYVELARELLINQPPKGSEAYEILQKLKKLLSTHRFLKTRYKGRNCYWKNGNSFSLGRTERADWILYSRIIPRVVYNFKKTPEGWILEFYRAEGNKPAIATVNGVTYKASPTERKEVKLPTPKGEVKINEGVYILYGIDENNFLCLELRIDTAIWGEFLNEVFPNWKEETSKKFLVKELI
jgi:hypothetical protein